MAGWVLKVMAATVAVVAATLVSAVSGAGIQRVLTLERAFPLRERVELEVIKARDRARHARILQSFSGGIVDFPVLVHSFLLIMFELSISWRSRQLNGINQRSVDSFSFLLSSLLGWSVS